LIERGLRQTFGLFAADGQMRITGPCTRSSAG